MTSTAKATTARRTVSSFTQRGRKTILGNTAVLAGVAEGDINYLTG